MAASHLTILDIARLAGVSRSTVSRVLNDNPEISPETKAHIQEVIAQTGYRPNVYARRVVMKLCNSIGLCIGRRVKILDANTHVLQGVIEKSAEEGYDLLICGGRTPKEMLDMYFERRVDGFIVLNPYPQDRELLEQFEQNGVPYVCTGMLDTEGSFCCVDTDNTAAAYAAVQHLIGWGHRRIAMLKVTDPIAGIQQRVNGYRACMQDHAPQQDESLETLVYNANGEYDFSGLKKLLDGPDPVTACFAVTDKVAMQAISWLQMNGYRVPGDVSVVGFDDLMEVLMGYPLTTIHQDFVGRGYNSCQWLLAQVRDGQEKAGEVKKMPAYRLVERQSVCAPCNK